MERDIFDDMIKRVDCSYVSDLRYNKKAVEDKLKGMDLSSYSEKQLKSKLSQYVSMANIFSNGEIPELEIIAYEKEDIDKLVNFMING